jgi:Na+-translocating ferredoxin:NAD+ oxidoreductase subunit G
VLTALCVVRGAGAEVYLAKDEALAVAFPAGTTVDKRTAFLTDAQLADLKAAGVELDSKMFTYYRGLRGSEVVGYAVIDSHVVRTQPEAFMAVLRPDGTIERVVMLAFYEPPEYAPKENWLAQFQGRKAGESGFRLGRDVHGITGATLTSNAIAGSLRKIAALYGLVMRSDAGGTR